MRGRSHTGKGFPGTIGTGGFCRVATGKGNRLQQLPGNQRGFVPGRQAWGGSHAEEDKARLPWGPRQITSDQEDGAWGRTRTGTGRTPRDFKSLASTHSATQASYQPIYYINGKYSSSSEGFREQAAGEMDPVAPARSPLLAESAGAGESPGPADHRSEAGILVTFLVGSAHPKQAGGAHSTRPGRGRRAR